MLYEMLFNPADGNVLCTAMNIVERGLIAYPFDQSDDTFLLLQSYFKVKESYS